MDLQALTGKYQGPILVIGGGPSALTDLAKLDIEPACVLSANTHGKYQDYFPIDYVVALDPYHGSTDESHEPVLRELGVPIIGRQPWADYQIEWPLGCNTGLTALAVAAKMGGSPVIGVGIDCYTGEQSYFHKPGRQSGGHGRRDYAEQMRSLKNFIPDTSVQAVSGPLTEVFARVM